jgi:hypothetical protein
VSAAVKPPRSSTDPFVRAAPAASWTGAARLPANRAERWRGRRRCAGLDTLGDGRATAVVAAE